LKLKQEAQLGPLVFLGVNEQLRMHRSSEALRDGRERDEAGLHHRRIDDKEGDSIRFNIVIVEHHPYFGLMPILFTCILIASKFSRTSSVRY
jgi:hypothetical protein